MTWRGWRGLVAVPAVLALPVVSAATVLQGPDLTVDPATAAPSTTISGQGRGFVGCVVPTSGDGPVVDQDVTITSELGIPDADLLTDGTFSFSAVLAPDVAPGTYTVTARCGSRVGGADPTASAEVEVTPVDTVVVPVGPTDVTGPGVPPATVVPGTAGPGAATAVTPVVAGAAVVGAVALVALPALLVREVLRRRPAPAGQAPTVRVRVHRGVPVRPTVEHGSGAHSGLRVVPRADPGRRTCAARRSRP